MRRLSRGALSLALVAVVGCTSCAPSPSQPGAAATSVPTDQASPPSAAAPVATGEATATSPSGMAGASTDATDAHSPAQVPPAGRAELRTQGQSAAAGLAQGQTQTDAQAQTGNQGQPAANAQAQTGGQQQGQGQAPASSQQPLAPASLPSGDPPRAQTGGQAQVTGQAPASSQQPSASSVQTGDQGQAQAVGAGDLQPQAAAGIGADPASQLASCDPSAPVPAPLPIPGSGQATGFFRGFRDPLPPAPLYDPPGQKRIGLQAGHWLTNQVPAELRGLGGGAVGGGKEEWQVNLDVAQRTAALLDSAGFQVDVLPATVPEHYQANLFVALHADGDTTGQTRGFKVARPGFSSIPSVDDRLVDVLNQAYGAETELPRDDEHISLRMRYYYAFNSRRYCHAVMPGVPQAIVEMAYLTNATDRQFLIGDPQKLAQALADGIQGFLATTP